MQTNRKYFRVNLLAGMVGVVLFSGTCHVLASSRFKQERPAASSLTPLQLEIEKQRMRLSSAEVEERRDALTRLAAMHNADASRAAIVGLADPVAIVKVAATVAILSLPSDQSAQSLIPLLSDKDEFVRREAAFALGNTGSRKGVAQLVELLLNDKLDSVRGAAAVALGNIRDETAVAPLAAVLNPQIGLVAKKRSQKKKKPENAFVLRAAARSLGQIGSRAGLPALLLALQDEEAEADVRRESAIALGVIGDPSALPALHGALTALDPYLSQAAQESIVRIQRSNSNKLKANVEK